VNRVWVVEPKARKVFVHRSPVLSETFEVGQVLTDQELLPGFALPVAEIFPD
jgi:Uma2 family endonuclease